jgi:hypothetical protein
MINSAATGQPSLLRGGHGNLGMARGIAGPLALLSTAVRKVSPCTGTATPSNGYAADWMNGGRATAPRGQGGQPGEVVGDGGRVQGAGDGRWGW